MQENQYMDEFEGISDVVSVFKKIDPDVRSKVLKSVAALLDINYSEPVHVNIPSRSENNGNKSYVSFTEDRTMSPKEFLLDKKPQLNVEKIACLAYYLTHFREQPHFNTKDLIQLNNEAAQKAFSNTSVAISNAMNGGYLVYASKGQKQLSAYGELFVQALPDREAAKAAMQQNKPKRKPKKSPNKINLNQ